MTSTVKHFSNGTAAVVIDKPNHYILWRFMWWLGDAPPNYDDPNTSLRGDTCAAYAGSFGTICADLKRDRFYLHHILSPDFHCQWLYRTPHPDGTSSFYRLDQLSVDQHYNMILANMPVEINLDMNQRNGIIRFHNQDEAFAQGYTFPNKRKDEDVSPFPVEQSGVKWRNKDGQVSIPVWLDEYEDVKPRHKGNRSFVGMVVQMYAPK